MRCKGRAAALLACVLAACHGDPVPVTPTGVVLVTLDTVRADHLGTYGYFRDTTPFIDALAARGVVFERAYATSASTAPAHASIFTGRHPLQHGVRRNHFWLPAGTPTLAGVLQRAGWQTAGFVSASVLDPVTRIQQGFATYQETSRSPGRERQAADVTTDRAVAWVATVPDDARFFLWVHYFDAHAPYDPHPAQRAVLGPGTPAAADDLGRRLAVAHAVTLSPADVEEIARYDAALLAIDQQLQRLAGALETRTGPTLWVVTADHGEGLLNHGYWAHVTELYTEQTAIPLVFHWSHGGPPPRRIAAPVVSQTDIAPTVLELLDLAPAALPAAAGTSLASLVRAGTSALPPDRAVFAQMGGERDRCQDLFALQTIDRALITALTPGPERYYDLGVDRYETSNLDGLAPGEQAALRARLLAQVHAMIATGPGYGDERTIQDDDALDRLRALGYVQ